MGYEDKRQGDLGDEDKKEDDLGDKEKREGDLCDVEKREERGGDDEEERQERKGDMDIIYLVQPLPISIDGCVCFQNCFVYLTKVFRRNFPKFVLRKIVL